MHFFQSIRWASLFHQSRQSQSSESAHRAKASKARTTPKQDGRIEPVLTALETRALIGSFVPDIALAAGGVAVAQRASDLFGESAWVDLSVSGGYMDGEHALARSGTGTLDANVFSGATQNQPGRTAESSNLPSTVSGAGFSPHANNSAALGLNDIYSLPSTIGSTLLASALDDVVPRLYGDFRSLPLAPLAGGGAGSSGGGATTSAATPRRDSDIEIPSPSGQASPASRTAAEPFVPPIQPPTNAPNDSSPAESNAQSLASGGAEVESGGGSSSRPDGLGDDTDDSGEWKEGTAGGGGEGNSLSPNAPGGPGFEAPGKKCLLDIPPGQSAGPGASLGSGSEPSTLTVQPSTPQSSPCTPPGQQSLSVVIRYL